MTTGLSCYKSSNTELRCSALQKIYGDCTSISVVELAAKFHICPISSLPSILVALPVGI